MSCRSTAQPSEAELTARYALGIDFGTESARALLVDVADLHRLGIPVVVCSTHEEPAYVRRALDAGARAYVAKRDAGSALVRTVRDVLNGWMLISPRAADELGSGP